jgi:hypothetical protein
MFVLLFVISLFPSKDVRADVAPPETPPGANLYPGEEATQVRMVAETVILDVRQNPNNEQGAVAHTSATFTMRNLGTESETMRARFPLSFLSGSSDGFGNYPEIDEIAVKINGNGVRTKREMQPAMANGYQERPDVPWAVFDVTFPPGEDVTIEVKYLTFGFGYYPYDAFKYILETGAGWKDTIGSADIIVRLPYEVSRRNIWLPDDTTGYSQTSPGAVLNGKEVKWHFDNLEPTAESNIEITLVTPALWQKVLNETNTVTRNPKDGEAWGRLGKAYKEIAIMPKGYPRGDADGYEVFDLSRQAYEKCLTLLPEDALWQFGYADLLWPHFYFDVYMASKADTEGLLTRILIALKTSLELDPNNERAKDLLTYISYSIPNSILIKGSTYDFLALTATPIPPTPYLFVTETPLASATVQVVASPTADVTTPSTVPTLVPDEQPKSTPVCGGAGFILPLLVGVLLWKRKVL